jgi:hypothetical protein
MEGVAMKRGALSKTTATVLLPLLLFAAAPASAATTVNVHFVYGSFAIGGMGIYFFFSGFQDLGLRELPMSEALMEFSNGRSTVGFPALLSTTGLPGEPETPEEQNYELRLVQWRF